MTKQEQTKLRLLNMINEGNLPDGHLPGERELAASFGVGRNTLRAALKELADEGLVVRCRKKGTSVKNTGIVQDKGIAGLIVQTTGHLYDEMYHHLLTLLMGSGYSVRSVSVVQPPESPQTALIERGIKKILASNPQVLVLDGSCLPKLPCAAEIKKHKPVWINFHNAEHRPATTGVWFDYRRAGYLAGKHLIRKGCRHPVLFQHYMPAKIRLAPGIYCQHREKMIADGFSQAMTEGGLDPNLTVINPSGASFQEHSKLLELLSSDANCMPDGFCGSSDYLTVLFMKNLLEFRQKIPKNICFTGIGNTPWSQENALYPFTSVDLNLENAAKMVVRQADLAPEQRENIYIEPKLIVRD
ncbi:MAG: GntR family transcriptional regulator [Lentisphaeria bacterium]|nr:GntR family transcriptional regulator [Lentisphaeria bacterium]